MEMKKVAWTIIAVVGIVSGVFGAGYNAATALANARTRIVSRSNTECPGKIVLTYVRGLKTWKTTNEIHKVAIKLAKTRYSKLKLITAAKAAGKWDIVKAWIESSGYEDEWNACQYIEEGNAVYVAATNKVVASGLATDEQVKAFMRNAIDDDPVTVTGN